MKSIMVLLALITSSLANAAGGTVGNGGNVVLCSGKVKMLDLYEAESLRGFEVSLGDAQLAVEKKIEIAARRLYKVDEQRASFIFNEALSFLKSAAFVPGIDITSTQDSDQPYLPTGCQLKQIAVQNKKVLESDAYYIVSKDLWEQMDNDSKAILAIHEAIYSGSNSWKSDSVRYLNSIAFSSYLDKKSAKEYYRSIFSTKIESEMVAVFQGHDGKWLFQLPAPSGDREGFSIGGFVRSPKSEMHDSTNWCAIYGGVGASSVSRNDLKEIYYYKTQINFRYPLTPIIARDGNGETRAFVPGSIIPKKITDLNVQAEEWCISPRRPNSPDAYRFNSKLAEDQSNFL